MINRFDRFEEKHPYIAGVICLSALFMAMYGLLIIGHLAGY